MNLLDAGSGPVFVLSCNRRFESIGEALKNVCQGEVVRLQPRMYLEVSCHLSKPYLFLCDGFSGHSFPRFPLAEPRLDHRQG